MNNPFAITGVASLLVVSAFHALWVFSPWPFASHAEFAEVVVGVAEADAPGQGLTSVVAILLAFSAWLVAVRGGLVPGLGPNWIARAGAWTVGGVLALRGVGGFLMSSLRLVDQPDRYVRADLAIYSPVCVAIAACVLATARTAER